MPNPTSTSDLEARWRALTDAELSNAEAFLDDAWALLQARRPTLEDDMIDGTVAEANVRRVVCAMVLRVLKNPDGYDSESLDDWSGHRNALTASGLLYVSPEELADVTPGRREVRSVRLTVYGDA